MEIPYCRESEAKAIIFDCDGVLCPSDVFANVLWLEHKISKEMTKYFFSEIFPVALMGKADINELLKPVLNVWGWKWSVDDFLNLWFESERSVRPELLEFIWLLKAKGYFLYLATNQERQRAAYLKQKMGFADLFTQCFISSEMGIMKADPMFFEVINNSIRHRHRKILYIDDEVHYVKNAIDLGWAGVVFTDFSETKSAILTFLNIAL